MHGVSLVEVLDTYVVDDRGRSADRPYSRLFKPSLRYAIACLYGDFQIFICLQRQYRNYIFLDRPVNFHFAVICYEYVNLGAEAELFVRHIDTRLNREA